MKFSLSHLSARSLAPFLGLSLISGFIASCSSGGGDSSMAGVGHGPFDSRGNYVEAWADNPEKWKGRSISTPPAVSEPEPVMLASNDAPPVDMTPVAAAPAPRPVQVASLKPSASSTSIKPRTSSTTVSTKAKTTVAKAPVKAKPKTVATKSRASSSSRVVVKKGDTLYGLALRHKTSVTAIQKANGLRDSKLSIGRALVIPRS